MKQINNKKIITKAPDAKKIIHKTKKILSPETTVTQDEHRLDFIRTFDTTVIGAFTFVAGLFWRDVAVDLIAVFIPKWSGLIGNLLTALIVTIVVVWLAVRANKRSKKLEHQIEERKKEAKKKNKSTSKKKSSKKKK